VEQVGADPDRARPRRPLDLLAQVDRLVQPVDHVVLVAVDRLDGQPHALGGGVGGQLDQRLQEHLAVLVGLAGRGERGQAQAEHAPAGRGQDPVPAQLGDDAELGAQLVDGVAAPVGVEVADEVVGVGADGGHDHPGPGGRPQLGQPGREPAVAPGPQLDATEPGPGGELPLLLEAAAGQQLLLAGKLHAHRLPSDVA
jgi:hypothetical protein